MSFCEIILVGNVGRDPELRYPATGSAVCSFSLAVNRNRRVNDEWVKETTWFKITLWGDQAERINQLVSKGKQVLVVADRIEATAFMSKDTNEPRASLEVTARQVRLLGAREEGDSPSGGAARGGRGGGDYYEDYGDAPTSDNDIPF